MLIRNVIRSDAYLIGERNTLDVYMRQIVVTLHPSQVKAPKWNPAAGSPQTLHCWFIWNKTKSEFSCVLIQDESVEKVRFSSGYLVILYSNFRTSQRLLLLSTVCNFILITIQLVHNVTRLLMPALHFCLSLHISSPKSFPALSCLCLPANFFAVFQVFFFMELSSL